ncbi:DUF4421 domain-containing protein [Aquiflexum sp.]|uniref:DUF4421 domain-containing protein n=1 Tax=Aquiflexum sp. TaxID=1872584 RepID=UPI003593168F
MDKFPTGIMDVVGHKVVFICIVLSVTMLFFNNEAVAQHDTLYYVNYPKMLTSRIYISRKYTSLNVSDKLEDTRFRFEPNSTHNLGIGATYNDFTLNLAYGFGFMNRNDERGETKFLDLQAHMYPRKLVIDLFAQIYNGYYLQKIDGENVSHEDIMLLPDLQVRKFGANFQYLFNGDKVSLKAAFHQGARQKKSAGSFLAGVEFYGGWATNEGMLIPAPIQPNVNGRKEFQNLGFFQMGPNVGYVHTFVFWKYFFITGMASTNLAIGQSYLDYSGERMTNLGVSPNLLVRGFAGYNGLRWSVNANYVHNRVRMAQVNDFSNAIMTGNYRMNLVYRFDIGPKLRPILEYVNLERYFPKGLKQKKEN